MHRYLWSLILVAVVALLLMVHIGTSVLASQNRTQLRHVLVRGHYECVEDEYLRIIDKRPGPDVFRCTHIEVDPMDF